MSGASFPAGHGLVTNGTPDPSDIDNPSPDARWWENKGQGTSLRTAYFLLLAKSADRDNAYITKSEVMNHSLERISECSNSPKQTLTGPGQVWHREILQRVFTWMLSFLSEFHLSLK